MRAAPLLVGAVSIAACATLAGPPGGNDALPSANAGPFRAITLDELGNGDAAPYAVDDSGSFARDPSVVDLDGDPSTLGVAGYFAVNALPGAQASGAADLPVAIVRLGALDGRSFDAIGKGTVALSPTHAWEGGTVGAPSVLRVNGAWRMYYAAAGGIGLATSQDGLTFTARATPVLAAPSGGTWEGSLVPRSPGVVQLPDGTFRLFYEVSSDSAGYDWSAIGEASSSDGILWSRLGEGPALAPSRADDALTPYDDAAVGGPFPVLGTTSEGRPLLRLYYGARDHTGVGTIGLAARFGTDGPFQRGVSSLYGASTGLGPGEPCVLFYPSFTLLFATELEGKTASSNYPAVSAGVAPALAALGPPNPL